MRVNYTRKRVISTRVRVGCCGFGYKILNLAGIFTAELTALFVTL
jgi:hypothetical protein